MGTRELQLDKYSVAALAPTTDRSITPATEPILASHETKLQLIFGQDDSALGLVIVGFLMPILY